MRSWSSRRRAPPGWRVRPAADRANMRWQPLSTKQFCGGAGPKRAWTSCPKTECWHMLQRNDPCCAAGELGAAQADLAARGEELAAASAELEASRAKLAEVTAAMQDAHEQLMELQVQP